MSKETADELRCEECGEEFKSVQGLGGHRRLKHGIEEGAEVALVRGVAVKPLPLDAVIENLRLPEVPERYSGSWNVYVEGFNAGVRYGTRTVLAGIRAAQELSSLGVTQAIPVIKMAQEMRAAEGQAGKQAVDDMMGRVMPFLEQRLSGLEGAVQSAQTGQAGAARPAVKPPSQARAMVDRITAMMMGQVLKGAGLGPLVDGMSGQGEVSGFTTETVKTETVKKEELKHD